jgi:hypothetical protein
VGAFPTAFVGVVVVCRPGGIRGGPRPWAGWASRDSADRADTMGGHGASRPFCSCAVVGHPKDYVTLRGNNRRSTCLHRSFSM